MTIQIGEIGIRLQTQKLTALLQCLNPVNTRVYLKGKTNTFLEAITCIKRNSILTMDSMGKYWNLCFKIGNE